MKQLTFLDLCSGIGGFRLGLETAGHKCIGYCEYDKFARASYEAMYDTEGEWKADDVTKLRPDDVPYADIWCFGFPCQDISVAGKQRGLVGKRSGIYYNIIDLIKGKEESDKPTYLLVENVKNLLSINAGFDFASVLAEMDEAGYDCRWQVLNSKNFGVPQNRERVFIIANLRSRGRREILPVCGEDGAALNKLVDGMQGYRVYGTDGISATLVGNAGGIGAKTGLYYINRSDKKVEVHPVLTPDRMTKRQNGRRMKNDGEPMFTLTGQDRHGVFICSEVDENEQPVLRVKNCTKKGYDEATVGDGINLTFPKSKTRRGRVGKQCSQTLDCSGQMGTLMKSGRVRRLTPRECFRLQGFSDEMYECAASVNSDAQLYKQAGNAVTATVAFAVAMSLPESREKI